MAYEFQPAEAGDSQGLLEMMEERSAEGSIELLYTRRPDPLASFLLDGDETSLGVVRSKDGRPILMEASLFRRLYIGGEVRKTGYLCGLRKKQGVFFKGNPLKLLFEYEGGKSDYCFCSILDANKEIMGLLSKKRPYTPELTELCSYRTYMVKPEELMRLNKRKPGRNNNGTAEHAADEVSLDSLRKEDLQEVYDFLADYGKGHDLFPSVIDLERQFPGLKMSDCLVARVNSRVVGFGALWDQRGYKQYIVRRYKGAMKLARWLSPVVELAGYVPVPEEGGVLPLATLSLLAAQNHDRSVYELLISSLAEEARKRMLPILVLGLPEDNWQRDHIEKIKSLHFDSRLYSMEWPGKSGIAAARSGGKRQLQVECGLL